MSIGGGVASLHPISFPAAGGKASVGEKKKAIRILAKQSVRRLESWYLVLGGLPGRKLTYGAHSVHTPDEMKARHWVKRRNEPNQPKRMKCVQDERPPIARVTLLEQIVSSRQSCVRVQNVQIRRQIRLSAILSLSDPLLLLLALLQSRPRRCCSCLDVPCT